MGSTFGRTVVFIRESLEKVFGREMGFGKGPNGMGTSMKGNMFETRNKVMEYTIGILGMYTRVIISRI